MKTKKTFSWNILLACLACFLFITSSGSGMFSETFWDKFAEMQNEKQAEQQQRTRETTSLDNQDHGLSIVKRADLNGGNGPVEKIPEQIEKDEKIHVVIRSYFPSISQEEEVNLVDEVHYELQNMEQFLNGSGRILTEEAEIYFIFGPIAKKAGVIPPATVADAVAAYKERVFSLTETELPDFPLLAARLQRGDFSNSFTTPQPAAVKIINLSPPKPLLPPQESEFEKQKNAELRSLQARLAPIKDQLAKHEETKKSLQQDLERHLREQPRQQNQDRRQRQQEVDDFKSLYPIRSRIPGTDEYYQLNAIRKRRDNASLAESDNVRAIRSSLNNITTAIQTLTSSLHSLEKEHARVAASEDPFIIEQRRQKEAIAREQSHKEQRQREAEEGKNAGLAQRKKIEDQLAEQQRQQKTTRQVSTGSHSEGSTSGEESHHSTPEKQPPAFAIEALSEVQLQAEIDRIHGEVQKARSAVKEAQKDIEEHIYKVHGNIPIETVHAFWNAWTKNFEHYFNLAERRSVLKQHLATLKGLALEPFFKASDKKALLSQYRDCNSQKRSLFEFFHNSRFPRELQDIYERHRIHNMDDYRSHSAIQELERPLNRRLQEARQWVSLKVIEAELALLAPEEHPQVLQQIEECIWQNMPGFSEAEKAQAMKEVYARHCLNVGRAKIAAKLEAKYGTPVYTGSSDWQKSEAQRGVIRGYQEASRQFWENNRQQQVRQWNAQQSSMAWSASNNGGYYQPNYRLW